MFENGSTEICGDKVPSAETEKCTVSVLSDRLSSENFVPFPPSILVNNEPNNNCPVNNEIESRRKFTRKQWILVICIIYGNTCIGAAYAMIAPFFPKEAEEKGLTPSQYGFVFAVYEIGCFVLCPIFGKMIPHLSPKFFMVMGLFIGAYCANVFCLLRWSQPGTIFLVLSLVIRCTWSVGGAAFMTGSYTSVALYFPNHATVEMSNGMGLLIGPALGGVLYELGGFHLPFIGIGIVIAVAIIPLAIILPERAAASSRSDVSKSCGLIRLFSNFGVSLNILVNIISCVLFGFNEATLDHHLREFASLSASQTGLIFVLCGAMYAASSQVWGFICDRLNDPQKICIYGFVLSIVSFSLVGPIYGLPLEPSVPLAIVGQLLFGAGVGGQIVGSFASGLKAVEKSDLPKGVATSALVASVYASSFSFGTSIGPAIGGVLIDTIGYRVTCIPVVGIQLLMILLIIVYMIKPKK